MLFDTTHLNKEFDQESNRILGGPFSFIRRIRMGGIGSSRFVIEELCSEFQPKFQERIASNFSNIELRPGGIIIHFTNRLERFSWIIHYHQLRTSNTDSFVIHSDDRFISYKKDKNFKMNEKFILKMVDYQTSFIKTST